MSSITKPLSSVIALYQSQQLSHCGFWLWHSFEHLTFGIHLAFGTYLCFLHLPFLFFAVVGPWIGFVLSFWSWPNRCCPFLSFPFLFCCCCFCFFVCCLYVGFRTIYIDRYVKNKFYLGSWNTIHILVPCGFFVGVLRPYFMLFQPTFQPLMWTNICCRFAHCGMWWHVKCLRTAARGPGRAVSPHTQGTYMYVCM